MAVDASFLAPPLKVFMFLNLSLIPFHSFEDFEMNEDGFLDVLSIPWRLIFNESQGQ